MNWLFQWFDAFVEKQTRSVAQRSSRRGALIRMGRVLVGSALLFPVLPFDRSAHAAGSAEHAKGPAQSDDTQCEYWRYCALDGYLCTCCGGSITECPPGTEVSKVTWVGTCRNPLDGKDYLITYNDCCGAATCGRCLCNANVRERPAYRLGVHNDINWCMANHSNVYHCTVAAIVDVVEAG